MLDVVAAGFPSGTGAFLIGTGFVLGTTGAHESFGFVVLGVVGGVLGLSELVIDGERIKPVCEGDLDSLAVNKIDCLKAGLTIS